MKTYNYNQEAQIKFLCEKENTNVKEYQNLKIAKYESDDKIYVKIWVGKQSKPAYFYYFKNKENRNEFIVKCKKESDKKLEYKNKMMAKKKAFKMNVKEGEIFVSSWGYDQTNVEFYQVIEVIGKRTVKLKEICQNVEFTGLDCGKTTPIKNNFLNEKVFTKRVSEFGVKINSVISAWKWDGTPSYKSWYA